MLCARCTRFSEQIAGDPFIALIERGALQQVGIYEKEPFESYFSGNTIQICPVGALTSRRVPLPLAALRPGLHAVGRRARRLRLGDPRRPPPRQGDASPRRQRPRGQRGVDHRQGPLRVPLRPGEDRLTYPHGARRADAGELRARVVARGVRRRRPRPAATPAASACSPAAGSPPRTPTPTRSSPGSPSAPTTSTSAPAPHSAEEAELPGLPGRAARPGVTYADLEAAPGRRAGRPRARGRGGHDLPAAAQGRPRGRTQVVSVAPYTSRGLRKMPAGWCRPPRRRGRGDRAGSPSDGESALDKDAVILVGERLARSPGALTAAADLAAHAPAPGSPGCRAVPATAVRSRPAACPTCCPADVRSPTPPRASTWAPPGASDHLPEKAGRDANAIVAALAAGELGGLVVGGVDPDDTADPAALPRRPRRARFVVSLELRETDVTRAADVVFPVAPVTDKAGTFVTWEGRARSFDAVFANPALAARPAGPVRHRRGARRDGHGRSLGFRTVAEVRDVMRPSARGTASASGARRRQAAEAGQGAEEGRDLLRLASWKQLLDHGSMQDGEETCGHRPQAGRPPRRASYNAVLGMLEAQPGAMSSSRSAVTAAADAAVVVADMPDGVVWVPGPGPSAAASSPIWPRPAARSP